MSPAGVNVPGTGNTHDEARAGLGLSPREQIAEAIYADSIRRRGIGGQVAPDAEPPMAYYHAADAVLALFPVPAPDDTTDPLTEAIRAALGEVLWNASNYPRKAQPFMLGQDTAPLRDKATEAVVAVVRASGTTPAGLLAAVDALATRYDELAAATRRPSNPFSGKTVAASCHEQAADDLRRLAREHAVSGVTPGSEPVCDPWAACPVHGDLHWREHDQRSRQDAAERVASYIRRTGDTTPWPEPDTFTTTEPPDRTPAVSGVTPGNPTREPRHFAPYSSTNALCDETVPRGVAWDEREGEYADQRFTTRRDRTTCRECLRLMHPGTRPSPAPGDQQAEGIDAAQALRLAHRDERIEELDTALAKLRGAVATLADEIHPAMPGTARHLRALLDGHTAPESQP